MLLGTPDIRGDVDCFPAGWESKSGRDQAKRQAEPPLLVVPVRYGVRLGSTSAAQRSAAQAVVTAHLGTAVAPLAVARQKDMGWENRARDCDGREASVESHGWGARGTEERMLGLGRVLGRRPSRTGSGTSKGCCQQIRQPPPPQTRDPSPPQLLPLAKREMLDVFANTRRRLERRNGLPHLDGFALCKTISDECDSGIALPAINDSSPAAPSTQKYTWPHRAFTVVTPVTSIASDVPW
ncbi:hypothetical protein ACCO45_001228 [Purpureocillium lilacinum]|uniref:Uncharacterized protein n=1 Tax=Purpureocillium lilacinum TaxID=33203 RepID=A0ACC4E7U8_PURLI